MAPPRKAKRRPNRSGRPLNVWLPAVLLDTLDEYVAQTRPRASKSAIVEVAIEEYLERHGRWPPKENDNEQAE